MLTAPPPRSAATASGRLDIGSAFAGHRVDGIAGRGGMGIIYRATDLALSRPVALKLMAPGLASDPVFRARFESECRLAAAIDHPHAGNVLVAARDDGERAFLSDFGLTKERAVPSELTGTGLAIGTADYIAPEQAQGRELDGRADVYAPACVLYQSLAGSVPYERDSDLENLWAHIHQPPPALVDVRPELPPALGEVLTRAMAKDPAERPASAGRFAREALTALAG